MGKLSDPESAMLFAGTLYADAVSYQHAKEILQDSFGGIFFETPPAPWEYSSYYRDELGFPITRQFIFFNGIIDPGILAGVKIRTNAIEALLSSEGKRKINIDPGYLTLSKVVLASTKNYVHRIYLGKGIYAEVTLIFRDNAFRPHLFTYRDYQDKAYTDMFRAMRIRLKKILDTHL